MDALKRMNGLLANPSPTTTTTSVRLPTSLHEAATIAVNEQLIPSVSAALTNSLADLLYDAVVRGALDAHYTATPHARPSLLDLVRAEAALAGDPLADEPERLRAALSEMTDAGYEPTPPEVLTWARAKAH